MAALINEVVVPVWDKKAKEKTKVSVKLKDLSTSTDMSFLEKYVKASEGSEPKTKEDKQYESKEEAKIAAETELIKAINTFIEGNLECIGDTELISGTCIKIEGLGDLFSGNYYITSTKHTFDTNGYKTTLGVRRIIL